jgi:hypothetical protein
MNWYGTVGFGSDQAANVVTRSVSTFFISS